MRVSLKLTCLSGMRDGEIIQVQNHPSLAETNDVMEVILGRSEDCMVSFPEDPELSRRHARLLWNVPNSSWRLEDLKSTNGTYLGEFKQAKRISEPVALAYGDVFRVGRTCLRLEPPLLREIETAAAAYAQAGEEPSQTVKPE
ncbi:MAG TPA: FHA domain-containing protein [Bacillota bacterium]|nr:FHA domain-containing protein [Bacillota bacterium]